MDGVISREFLLWIVLIWDIGPHLSPSCSLEIYTTPGGQQSPLVLHGAFSHDKLSPLVLSW